MHNFKNWKSKNLMMDFESIHGNFIENEAQLRNEELFNTNWQHPNFYLFRNFIYSHF